MRLLGIFFLFLAVLSDARAASEQKLRSLQQQVRDVGDLSSETIIEVNFIGGPYSESLRSRAMAMRGREFRPTTIHQLLDWFHENGGDSKLEIFSLKVKGGVAVYLKILAQLKIGEILIVGNAKIATELLQAQMDLREGGDFDGGSAKLAADKLQKYYFTQGFLAASVRESFSPEDGKLVFKIEEGEPTLVGAIELSPLNVIEEKRIRGRYERDIIETLGISVGDRLIRERLNEGVLRVKEWLREHDFLTAKEPMIRYTMKDDGSVKLNVDIDYGPRIRFGFRGNSLFSYRELMAFVWEVKEVASGADYLSAIKRRIIEAYKDIGYANVEVNSLVKDDSSKGSQFISMVIHEGKKIQIEALEIEGIFSMGEKDSRKRFRSLANRLVQRDFFHEAGLNKAAELFADDLRSRGYLSAKLEFTKFDFNEDRSKVRVSLLFSEGLQTNVDDVQVQGNRDLSREEILSILAIEPGKPFDIYSFERGLVKLKSRYESLGHLSAEVTNEGSNTIVQYSRDNGLATIRLEIDEGPIYRVGEILVRGNQRTHARVVLRELPFISKDVITRDLLNEAEDNLRRLNLFASVIVRPIDRPGDENIKDLLILVEETEAGVLELSPGFRNDLGLRLGLGVAYQNLGGWHRSVSAQAVLNRRTQDFRFLEHNITLGFKEPYLAGWPIVFTTNLNLLRRQYVSFDANVSRLTTAIKRDITPYLAGFLEYGFERTEVKNARGAKYTKDDERTDFIGSITPGLIVDSRDDKFNPSTGFYSLNRFELASQFFGSESDIGFIRTTSSNSFYLPISDGGMVLALAMNVGFERSNIADSKIPIFKLFRLGGVGSIRGYAEDEIEVETQKDIKGSLTSLNYRAELRVPLNGSFGSALFMDAGNLIVDRFTLSPGGLRSSAGAGFRYQTPVGPVLLDFAWRLQSEDQVGDIYLRNIDRFKIHFAIGSF